MAANTVHPTPTSRVPSTGDLRLLLRTCTPPLSPAWADTGYHITRTAVLDLPGFTWFLQAFALHGFLGHSCDLFLFLIKATVINVQLFGYRKQQTQAQFWPASQTGHLHRGRARWSRPLLWRPQRGAGKASPPSRGGYAGGARGHHSSQHHQQFHTVG